MDRDGNEGASVDVTGARDVTCQMVNVGYALESHCRLAGDFGDQVLCDKRGFAADHSLR